MRFEHQFVEGAPQTLEPGILYVSVLRKSVLHLCACGCGSEVVTPLAPHRWQLIFDGDTVSLEPSVGNSILPCRSHYFITNSEVDWHRPMTDKGIAWARRRDQRAVQAAFDSAEDALEATGVGPVPAAVPSGDRDHTHERLIAKAQVGDRQATAPCKWRERLRRVLRFRPSRPRASRS